MSYHSIWFTMVIICIYHNSINQYVFLQFSNIFYWQLIIVNLHGCNVDLLHSCFVNSFVDVVYNFSRLKVKFHKLLQHDTIPVMAFFSVDSQFSHSWCAIGFLQMFCNSKFISQMAKVIFCFNTVRQISVVPALNLPSCQQNGNLFQIDHNY